MAQNNLADLSTTAASNIDFGGQSIQGTATVSTIDSMLQNLAAILAKFYDDIGATGTVGGTANAITLTSGSSFGSLANGNVVWFKAASANTDAATINVDGRGAKAIRRQGDTAIAANEIVANGIYGLRYDTAYNGGAGAWVLLNSSSQSSTNATLTTPTISNPTISTGTLTGSTLANGTITNPTISGATISTSTVNGGTLAVQTSKATTSGTSVDFTSIPSWVKRITVLLNGVSTNGTSNPIVQLGTSSGIDTSGYTGASGSLSAASTGFTSGFILDNSLAATDTMQGALTLWQISSNTWVGCSVLAHAASSLRYGSGVKALSGTLDRIRLTTAGGTDTFDAGSINIIWEG